MMLDPSNLSDRELLSAFATLGARLECVTDHDSAADCGTTTCDRARFEALTDELASRLTK